MYIVLLGAPGTGKGTQAQFISNAYNLPIVSAGHILRNISKKKTHFGQEIFKIIKQGKLVPNETITNIIQKEILKKNYQTGFILDGFPRTVIQAENLKNIGFKINYVFEFLLPDKVILQRLKLRKIDSKTGLTYNNFNILKLEKNNKKIKNLSTRLDDHEDIIQQRLKEHKKSIVDLEKFYINEKKKYSLKYYKINSLNTIQQINIKITKILGKTKSNDLKYN